MLPAEVVFINNEDKVVPRTKYSPLLYRRRFIPFNLIIICNLIAVYKTALKNEINGGLKMKRYMRIPLLVLAVAIMLMTVGCAPSPQLVLMIIMQKDK